MDATMPKYIDHISDKAFVNLWSGLCSETENSAADKRAKK